MASFCRMAGHVIKKGTNADLHKLIYLTGSGVTLHDILNSAATGAVRIQQMLQKLRVLTLKDVGDLWKKNKPAGGTVFRVCRPDENIEDGVHLQGVRACLRESRTANAFQYFNQLNSHIFNGTRLPQRQPFISTTRDPEQALWWSYAGILKVVAINLDMVMDDHDVLAWDVADSGRHRDLLLAPTARIYATKSAEVVLDNSVPAEACSVLRFTWSPFKTRSPSMFLHEKSKVMPKQLPVNPSDIEVIEFLAGSTQPVHIKLPPSHGGSTSKRKPMLTTTFVLKRGGYRNLDPWHCCMEFLGLKMYDAAKINVPEAAVYPIQVNDEMHLTSTIPFSHSSPTLNGVLAGRCLWQQI